MLKQSVGRVTNQLVKKRKEDQKKVIKLFEIPPELMLNQYSQSEVKDR
jgi:hypothetical protein